MPLPTFAIYKSILVIVNPGCIEPIRSFKIRILGGTADADDGIGLHILGFHFFVRKLRTDILFAITSIIVFLPLHSDRK